MTKIPGVCNQNKLRGPLGFWVGYILNWFLVFTKLVAFSVLRFLVSSCFRICFWFFVIRKAVFLVLIFLALFLVFFIYLQSIQLKVHVVCIANQILPFSGLAVLVPNQKLKTGQYKSENYSLMYNYIIPGQIWGNSMVSFKP